MFLKTIGLMIAVVCISTGLSAQFAPIVRKGISTAVKQGAKESAEESAEWAAKRAGREFAEEALERSSRSAVPEALAETAARRGRTAVPAEAAASSSRSTVLKGIGIGGVAGFAAGYGVASSPETGQAQSPGSIESFFSDTLAKTGLPDVAARGLSGLITNLLLPIFAFAVILTVGWKLLLRLLECSLRPKRTAAA